MVMTRRDFVALSSLGLVGAAWPDALWAQAPAAQPAPIVPEFKAVRGLDGCTLGG